MTRAPPLRLAGLHLLVLSSFAVAQPLFDLLGRNGEFFAARGSTRWDVVAFAVALAFVPPALLVAVEALTPRAARGAVHALLVAALVSLLLLELLREGEGPGWLLVALACLGGLGLAVLYAHSAAARLVVTVLAPAPLLFLALFLFSSEASRLTLSGTGQASVAAAQAQAPAIVVVFDELPVNSLLDRHGRIDPVRFPHFAALARDSTFFANNSVVSEGTLHGVPSLLTGRYPRPGELPVYHDHPQNLFTLLGGAADLHVAETETHLCPPKLCHESGDSFAARMASLYEDTSVVYLHELLPDDLARGIPSVSSGWQDFWRKGVGGSDPAWRFRSFLTTVRRSPRPALWYLHLLLPHSPWRFLPTGERYEIRQAPGWSAAEVWTDNQAAVDQYWQRHLLQLGFTDRLLGRLIARLRAAGIYDRSLVVVTADEGLSFLAGEKRRPASDANLADIAYVPLLVKLPHQRRGQVVSAPSQSIDVLPTIAAGLGIRLPWAVDGRNALSPHRRTRNVVVAKDEGKRFVVPAGELEARRRWSLRRQVRLFGSDEPLATLYGVGPYRRLLGRSIVRLHVSAGPQVRLDSLDRGTDPVQVSGRVKAEAIHDVAIASGGKIVAVAPVDRDRFWALVPRAAFGAGKLGIYSIEKATKLRRLSF